MNMNITFGDYGVLKVVQTSNKSVVLATPVPGPWYLQPNNSDDFRLEVPVKISAGVTLRLTITTTVVLNNPTVAVNYKLWQVLV
jgi:hypothetical protein